MFECKCLGSKINDIKNSHLHLRANTTGTTGHVDHKYLKILDIQSDVLNIEEHMYWNNCVCNEFDAVTRRHAPGDIPGYDKNNEFLSHLENELMSYSAVVRSRTGQLGRCSHELVMANTRSSIKKRYRRAYYNIVNGRVVYNDMLARGKSFVKYEKIPLGKYYDGKPPRLIQHRSFEYLYLFKSFILSYDLALKNHDLKFNGQDVKTIFSKLNNESGVATALKSNWDSFKTPIAVCIDHSKFDGHVSLELLQAARKYWKSLFGSKLLDRMLKDQQLNKVNSKNGLFYKVKATRLSGEYTTSDENSILNYAMLAVWVKSSGIEDFRITVNGDDSVVMVELIDQHRLKDLSFFRNFNMETEVDRIVTDFNKITFCQASPILVGDHYTMIKDPSRTISRSCVTNYSHRQHINTLLTASGLCELAQNSGVPIMQEFALTLMRCGLLSKPWSAVDKIPARGHSSISEVNDITEETRNQFDIAFGIHKIQQYSAEAGLAGTVILNPNSIKQTDSLDLDKFLIKYKNFIS